MNYTCDNHRPIQEGEVYDMKESAFVFATRKAKAKFGKRGECRTCNQDAYSPGGNYATYSAFIGTSDRQGNTHGHNVTFTVYAEEA